jgi:farnesyl-diphosphate farnesyltransferase
MIRQIEKFIETLFPSQTAEDAQRKVSGYVSAEDEQKKKQEKEAREDMFMMFCIMGAIIAVVTVLMVRTIYTFEEST